MAPLLPYPFQGLAVWLFHLTVSQNHQKLNPTCTTSWPSPQQLFVLLFLINLSLCRTWQLERISLLVTSLGMWDRFHPSLLSSCPSLLDGHFDPPMKVCHLPSPPHSCQVLIPPEPLLDPFMVSPHFYLSAQHLHTRVSQVPLTPLSQRWTDLFS